MIYSMRALAGFLLVFSLGAPVLRADELTEKMSARLSEEAEAFLRIAPLVLGHETLQQKALKPPRRFRPRVGTAATAPPKDDFQQRTLISEYGFGMIGSSLHELRQVTSVDGRKVSDPRKAQESLTRAIAAKDEQRLKEALQQLEKHGLRGAATDFGQLLLLFTRREIERYEFVARGGNLLNGEPVRVFSYKQVYGPEALTLVEGDKDGAQRRFRAEGEIWTRPDFLPLRITIVASDGTGAAARREEAAVDYKMSDYGALLPVTIAHREIRAGKTTAENLFTYSDFHKFGASSDIKFVVEK
jgi:hypothetical protein